MSKGKKRAAAAQRRLTGENKATIKAVGDAFFADMYGDLEPLTDALIEELVGRGWERAGLLSIQQMGGRYSRKRNSFDMGGGSSFDDEE